MNLEEFEKQVVPELIKLAESPPVQAELEAAKVAIFNAAEREVAQAIPWGLRTIARLLRWINKKIKGVFFIMDNKFNLKADADTTTTGNATITVQNSAETALAGAAVSVTINDIVITATTGTDGTVTFSDLAVGTQTFTAELDGYTTNTVDVTVEAGDTVAGTITLIATAESAVTTVITEVLSELSDLITDASTEAVNQVIADLETEIDTTSSLWVKIRDNMEKAVLTAIKTVVISTLINALTDKIESYLQKVLVNEKKAQG
ncbi:MAG: hypothetical protein H6Q67_47 [Firmicutes bacterium]|nr:hypothetical protein [Bacillota bacterium]